MAGCGGESEPDSSGAPRTEAVTMSELKFVPSRVTVAAESSLAIHNAGSQGHDLKLRRNGTEIGGTEILNPGESQRLQVLYPPGSYEMYCSVPGHEKRGMKGTFTVVSSAR